MERRSRPPWGLSGLNPGWLAQSCMGYMQKPVPKPQLSSAAGMFWQLCCSPLGALQRQQGAAQRGGQALTKLPINPPDGWASPSNPQHLDANRHAALAVACFPGQHPQVCTQQDRQVAARVPLNITTTFYSWHGTQRDEWGWYEKLHHPAIMCLILQCHSQKLYMYVSTYIHIYIHTYIHRHTNAPRCPLSQYHSVVPALLTLKGIKKGQNLFLTHSKTP